jgi:hypothetical protein
MSEQLLLHQRSSGSENDEKPRARRRMRTYLAAFVTGGALSIALFYGALAVLHALDRLPPPPVSGTWCIDNRFAWLREAPSLKEAHLVAVGSSTTWRNLDFGVVPSELKDEGVVNAAPCFLTINQTRYLTEYYLQRAPEIKTFVTVLTPRDFEGCSRNPTAFFDPEVADPYIGGQASPWWLYFRNFRFRDVLLHAIYADERRLEMNYDRYGSGPLTRAAHNTGRPFRPEPPCYSELTRLAGLLESKGVQFIAVTFPIMPGWAALHDPSGVTQASFRSAIQAALTRTKAILVDGMTDWRVPDSAFTDPVHLQWPETAAFTRFILNEARRQGADLPPWKEGEDNSERDNGRKNSRTDEGGSVTGKTHRIGFNSVPVQVKHVRKANDSPDAPSLERQSDFTSTEQPRVTASMLEAIAQNTAGYSEGYPVGVPRNYAWCRGSYKPAGYSSSPAHFTAVTGWGQVYPTAGAPAYSNPEGSIAITNAKTYVHFSTTGEWVLVQKQVPDSISGAHFVSDYKPRPGVAMKLSEQTDGSVFIPVPPPGYNDHFWISKRGTYPAGAVDGVYVQMDIKTNDPNMKFVANVGADWWLDATAAFVHGFANNPGAGMSNWVELSTQWATLHFASWSTSRLLADPPPPLAEGERVSALVLRRQAGISPPCISRM